MVLTVTLNPALDALVFVERLRVHAKNIARDKRVFVGGKGFNVAKALAALDVPVTALGFVGRADVEFFRTALEPRGIRFAPIPIAATRTNLKLTETDTGEETEINEPGVPVTPAELAALREAFRAELRGAEWVVLSGSVAPGVPATIYGELVREASARGVPILLDASGSWLREAVTAGPTAVHVNRAELGEWTGRTLDTTETVAPAARELAARGIDRVIVSMGAEGVLLSQPAGQWLARPPRLRAVSAVGAGDALCAGWVDALRRDRPPAEAVQWATAVAAASVLTAEAGAVDRQRALELLPQVAVQKLG